MNVILIYFARKYKGNWDKIYEALEKKEKVSIAEIKATEKWISKSKLRIITILDVDYPYKLKQAFKPPFVLWVKGDTSLLNDKIINLSGNQLNDNIKNFIDRDIKEYTKTHLISSCLYKGVEEYISEKSKRILYVAAEGIDENHKALIAISEYPPEAHGSRDTYRNRNRIIAALSDMLILFSSEKNGKINNLVTNYLNLGKEIYCYPGDGSEKDGNSELIKQGATLITAVKDVSC